MIELNDEEEREMNAEKAPARKIKVSIEKEPEATIRMIVCGDLK